MSSTELDNLYVLYSDLWGLLWLDIRSLYIELELGLDNWFLKANEKRRERDECYRRARVNQDEAEWYKNHEAERIRNIAG